MSVQLLQLLLLWPFILAVGATAVAVVTFSVNLQPVRIRSEAPKTRLRR